MMVSRFLHSWSIAIIAGATLAVRSTTPDTRTGGAGRLVAVERTTAARHVTMTVEEAADSRRGVEDTADQGATSSQMVAAMRFQVDSGRVQF